MNYELGMTVIRSLRDRFSGKQRGVTLIELLVVLGIVAILAVAGIYTYKTQVFKGYDAKRKADLNKISNVLEEYEKDNECYPASLPACSASLGSYIVNFPCDPRTGGSYYYEAEGSACPKWYRVFTVLETENDPSISKVGCTTGCGPGAYYNYYVPSPNAPAPEVGAGGTPPPTGGGGGGVFYGCFDTGNGLACQSIGETPVCSPNYYNDPSCSGCPNGKVCI